MTCGFQIDQSFKEDYLVQSIHSKNAICFSYLTKHVAILEFKYPLINEF